jgi:5-(carboxyamino)imidazole ribonucleotide mutase
MVALVMAMPSHWSVLHHTAAQLDRFGVPFRRLAVPVAAGAEGLRATVGEATAAGTQVFVVGVAGGDGLVGALAGMTDRPVLAVPIETATWRGLDALANASQATDAAVGTLAIGKAGALNAALLAVAILARQDAHLAARLAAFREEQTAQVLAAGLP